MTFIRSIHPDLSQTESQIERIASKTPVIQIVIVTLHPQMTSALCLCRFQQPQALRSFPLRYLSNAYDRVTSSFSEGYLLIIFSRTYRHHVRNLSRPRSERIATTFRTYQDHARNVSRPRSERIKTTFGTYQDHVRNVSQPRSERIATTFRTYQDHVRNVLEPPRNLLQYVPNLLEPPP